jgi:hypothetical protein
MSSGHGINSKQGRCYAFWTEVAKCREQPEATLAGCQRYVEDYLECLFHKKEVSPQWQSKPYESLLQRERLIEIIRTIEGTAPGPKSEDEK